MTKRRGKEKGGDKLLLVVLDTMVFPCTEMRRAEMNLWERGAILRLDASMCVCVWIRTHLVAGACVLKHDQRL